MRSKPLLIIVGVVALLLVCGLCGLTVYGSFAWINSNTEAVRVFDVALVSAEVTATETYQAADNLVIRSDAGDITVTAADVNQIEVEMLKKAWGADQAEAMAAAEALHVEVTESDGTLTLVFNAPETIGVISNRGGTDHINFSLRVPQELAVELDTNFGDITLEGTTGTAVLSTRFGDVTARGVAGAVQAESSNADILLEEIHAGQEDLRAETSFGTITVENSSAREISLTTSNGDVKLQATESLGLLEVTSSFGGITLQELTAESLSVTNRNGPIHLEDGQVSSELVADSQFGDIEVLDVTADSYRVHNSNGAIQLDGASGLLDLKTSFGGIEITNASDAILQIESSNGQVRFSGSLDLEKAHRVETSFGDIHLTIPPDSAFNLNLETSFGRISSDIPVTLSGDFGSETTNSQWNATINGGGPELNAKTSNGDIALEALAVSQ